MMVVTHEMAFARDVADRVVFMDGGYVVEEGSPEEVIGDPQQESRPSRSSTGCSTRWSSSPTS